MTRRHLLPLALVALTFTAGHASPTQKLALKVTFDPATPSIASVVKALGDFQPDRSGNRFQGTLILRKGVRADFALTQLKAKREVLQVGTASTRADDALNLRSVSSLTRFLEKLGFDEEEEREERKKPGFDPKSEEKDAGTEYLRALREYVRVRAYPFDRIDSEAYNRGTEQAARLKRAVIGKSGPGFASVPGVGGQWKFDGPRNLATPYRVYYGLRPSSGRVNAIAYSPSDPNTIYVGAPQGGVLKSTDGGTNWTALGDRWTFNTVSSLAVSSSNPNVIYAGTGDFQGLVGAYTMGIMKSTDGGTTWVNQGRAQFGNVAVSGIVIDPETPSTVTITTGRGPDGAGKVWRSTNGGTSWTAVINTSAAWSSISVGPADSSGVRNYYAVAPGALYRSTDRGATWTSLTSPSTTNAFFPPYIAASANDAKTAYLLSTTDQKIFKTTDSGANWTDITGSFPGGYNWSQGFYDWYIACYKDGSADHLFVGLIDVVESPDGGATWKPVGLTYTNDAITHNDQHSFAANPSNPNEVLIGNDGGLYRARRSGTTWSITGLSDKLGITQFYNVVWHPTDKNRILGGTQDNASPVSLGNLNRWENVGGGDGGFCVINPTNPNIQVVTIYGFTIILTRDNWATSQGISPDTGSDVSPFVTPIYQDPVRTNFFYGCTNYLWRYDLNTNSWTPRLGGTMLSNGSLIHVVSVAPTNGDVIYTGSDDGQLFVSTNAGLTWRKINRASLPNRAITSISVNPTDPKDIVIGLSGTGTGHIYRCTDTSVANPVFAARSGAGGNALPDVPLNAIARDPFKPLTTWYVGTDIGVFATGDAGATWQNATAGLGLPNVQVNSLSANARTGLLSAGTYGRGVWSIGFGTELGLPPSSFDRIAGIVSSGTLASLFLDDASSLILTSTLDPDLGHVAGISAIFDVPGTGTLAALEVSASISASAKVTGQLYIKNVSTGKFEILKAASVSSTRLKVSSAITGNLANYITSDRKIEIAVRGLRPTRLGAAPFRFSIDSVAAIARTND